MVADDAALLELGARRAGEPEHTVLMGKQTTKRNVKQSCKLDQKKLEILQQYKEINGSKGKLQQKSQTFSWWMNETE